MTEIIIWFITCFVSTLGFAFVFYKFADVPRKFNLKFFIVFWLGVLGVLVIQYYKIESLGHIAFFIFYPILFYCMKPIPFKKLFYYVVVIWLYATALDLIAMLIVSSVYHLYKIDVYSYSFECILTFFVFIIMIIFSYSKRVKIFTANLYKRLDKISYLDCSLIIFSIFALTMSVIMFLNLSNLRINILLLIIVGLMFIVFVGLVKFIISNRENKTFLKILKDNNEFYIKMEEENRIFRHNLNAKLLSVKSVANKDAKKLLDNFMLKNSRSINFSKNIKEIPYGLNGIIYEKTYPFMDKIEIKIINNVTFDIFKVLQPIKYNVLVEKMVIALDNALEACANSDKKVLEINISSQNSFIVVEIRNTFSNFINLDCIGNSGYSIKGKLRGLGIFSALRDNEATLNIKIVNGIFISKISTKIKVAKYKD